MLERGRLDFDEFRGSYFTALGGQYAFVEAPNGHLAPVFPVGAGILAAPIYGVLFGWSRTTGAAPPITSPAFEAQRRTQERFAAALLAAVSVALFFLCALEIGTTGQAVFATLIFAFASSMWTIGSQALWQHGPVNLCLLGAIYALLRAYRAQDARHVATWCAIAGVAAGFLPVVRPTALLFSAALAFYVVRERRMVLPVFMAAFVAGVLPGVVWNAMFFHSLAGGYAGNLGAYIFNIPANATVLAGLLFSPSRGLFVFTPVFLLAIAGIVRAARRAETHAALLTALAAACGLLIVQYSFFATWWGGFAYGPRFLTDVAAIASLALIYVMPRRLKQQPFQTAGILGLALLSAGVQMTGAFSGAAGSEWNAVPVSVDAQPERIWQIHDNQIVRNVKAFYYKAFAWDVAVAPAYTHGYDVGITGIRPNGTALAVTIRNRGTSVVYGYESGVYRGQTRIEATAAGASPQSLYLPGNLQPGESGTATGEITPLEKPGRYDMRLRAVLNAESSSTQPITLPVTIKP